MDFLAFQGRKLLLDFAQEFHSRANIEAILQAIKTGFFASRSTVTKENSQYVFWAKNFLDLGENGQSVLGTFEPKVCYEVLNFAKCLLQLRFI